MVFVQPKWSTKMINQKKILLVNCNFYEKKSCSGAPSCNHCAKISFWDPDISSWILDQEFQHEFSSNCYYQVSQNFNFPKNCSVCSDFMKRPKSWACKPNSEFGFKIPTDLGLYVYKDWENRCTNFFSIYDIPYWLHSNRRDICTKLNVLKHACTD